MLISFSSRRRRQPRKGNPTTPGPFDVRESGGRGRGCGLRVIAARYGPCQLRSEDKTEAIVKRESQPPLSKWTRRGLMRVGAFTVCCGVKMWLVTRACQANALASQPTTHENLSSIVVFCFSRTSYQSQLGRFAHRQPQQVFIGTWDDGGEVGISPDIPCRSDLERPPWSVVRPATRA